jgi:hypothetical protein
MAKLMECELGVSSDFYLKRNKETSASSRALWGMNEEECSRNSELLWKLERSCQGEKGLLLALESK